LSSTFNQPELNRKRLEALKKISPELFRSSVIEWKFVGQTIARTDDQAKNLFHGFVITFIPIPDKKSSKAELEFLSYIMKSDSLGKDSIIQKKKIRLKKKNHFTGFYYPRSARKRAENVLYTRRSIWGRK